MRRWWGADIGESRRRTAITAAIIAALVTGVAFCTVKTYAQNAPVPQGQAPGQIDTRGSHMISGGTPPSVGSCGTGPLIKGTDFAGHFIPGTSATACTLTFAGSFINRPSCVVSGESNTPSYIVATDGTGISFTSVVAGVRYNYICVGQAGG